MSVALTYPGVYVEELPSGVHTITGVATSIAAFIGWAPKGPVDRPVLVESWPEYESNFGGLYSGVYLGYAVNQFFANGGKQAYIIRLVWDGNLPTGTIPAPRTAETASVPNVGGAGALTFYASSPGDWGNNLRVRLVPQTGSTTRFSIEVLDATNGNALESFQNLSLDQADPRYVAAVIDTDSQYVTLVNPSTGTPGTIPAAIAADTIPAPTTFNAGNQSGGQLPVSTTFYYTLTALYPDGESEPIEAHAATSGSTNKTIHLSWTAPANFNGKAPTGYRIARGPTSGTENVSFFVGAVLQFDDDGTHLPTVGAAQPTASVAWPLAGGDNGGVLTPSTSDFENALLNDTNGHGLHLLDHVPIFNLLCVPGETTPACIQQLQAYAKDNRAFCIVDADMNATYATLQANGPAGLTSANGAENSALYFPWVSAPDPLANNRATPMPPCGFVAGIYAATDANRGVWKAPAGLEAGLTGLYGLRTVLTDLENGDLNIQGINCLREFRIYGDVVWGARTLLGADARASEWKYIPIRRLALFLETSLYEGTQWVVFEPNDERLWSQIRLNVGAFMQGLFLQGAFQGSTPQTAYFVKCDGENNPQSSIDQGIVNILVGFAPLYPAEFVVIQIQQLMASQG
jgi:Bacteriophage tail sheath protein